MYKYNIQCAKLKQTGEPRSDDVSLKILYCGVCYADVVWTRNKFGDSKYPVVPGYVFLHFCAYFDLFFFPDEIWYNSC
jgi:D-arabinose 1-dehydrogenase-like Zn-dependent alcohol dehydrogenase